MQNNTGARIKKLRLSLNMTQVELAEAIQSSIKSIQRFEHNRSFPDVHNLVRLATFFNVTTDYLLGLYDSQSTLLPMKGNALSNNTYKQFYEQYVLCKHQKPILARTYYWIHSQANEFGEWTIGGQTEWAGWADKECKKEIRMLREVDAENAIALCTRIYGTPLILHTAEDVYMFMLYGGQAIIEKSAASSFYLNS